MQVGTTPSEGSADGDPSSTEPLGSSVAEKCAEPPGTFVHGPSISSISLDACLVLSCFASGHPSTTTNEVTNAIRSAGAGSVGGFGLAQPTLSTVLTPSTQQ